MIDRILKWLQLRKLEKKKLINICKQFTNIQMLIEENKTLLNILQILCEEGEVKVNKHIRIFFYNPNLIYLEDNKTDEYVLISTLEELIEILEEKGILNFR